jgi:hypothetical protein
VVFGCLASLFSGCASWYESPVTPALSGLASSAQSVVRASPDTLDIETLVVRFGEDHLEAMEKIWQSADESCIDFQQRQLMDRNGLRAGIIHGELPPKLRDQLDSASQQKKNDVIELAGLGSDAESRMRLMRCRAGRRKDIVIRREITRPLSVVTTFDGQLSGQTFYDRPVALFSLTPFPTADGKAAIELIPEVQYGEAISQYVTSEVGVRQELRRASKIWKSLKVRAVMSPGDVLMVACTAPPKSLGGAFFVAETVQQTEEYLVLLVRLAATQLDDMFDEDQIANARAMMEQW